MYFAPLPLFHIAGQWALVYACLQVGATAIVRRRFSVSDFWAVVKESGATVSFLLMRQYGVAEALTTDRHFEQEGFGRLLRP